MRILIVGAGAVGGYFGGRLLQAGRDVIFLVRSSRAKQLRERGLEIVSPYGDARLTPKSITAKEIAEPYDLVLVSVKGFALNAAMEDFAPAVGPRTMILPVLNGMRHMDLLSQRSGEHAVLGGVCVVATDVDADGRIHQLNKLQQLMYGEQNGEITPRIRELDQTMHNAGFEATVSSDILAAMWQKWVQLASLGALTCLMRAPVGEIASVGEGKEVARGILDECAAIAAASGYPQSEEFIQRQSAGLTEEGSPATSSMYRDLSKGNPVEADTILGDLYRRGRQHGVVSPLLGAAFVNLAVYQEKINKTTSAELVASKAS
jgi:2-dehydropantoate 2-reductase